MVFFSALADGSHEELGNALEKLWIVARDYLQLAYCQAIHGRWQQCGEAIHASRYSGVNISQRADVTCVWSEQGIAVEWQTNIGTQGTAILPKSRVTQPPAYQPLPVACSRNFFSAPIA
jgi:hypothetical protein